MEKKYWWGSVSEYEIYLENEEIELDSGYSILINFGLTYNITNEKNYGADADGNRGIDVTWIEDIEIRYVEIKFKDNDYNILTNYSYRTQKKVITAIERLDLEEMVSNNQ